MIGFAQCIGCVMTWKPWCVWGALCMLPIVWLVVVCVACCISIFLSTIHHTSDAASMCKFLITSTTGEKPVWPVCLCHREFASLSLCEWVCRSRHVYLRLFVFVFLSVSLCVAGYMCIWVSFSMCVSLDECVSLRSVPDGDTESQGTVCLYNLCDVVFLYCV